MFFFKKCSHFKKCSGLKNTSRFQNFFVFEQNVHSNFCDNFQEKVSKENKKCFETYTFLYKNGNKFSNLNKIKVRALSILLKMGTNFKYLFRFQTCAQFKILFSFKKNQFFQKILALSIFLVI